MLGKGKNAAYADDAREKVSTLIGKETTFDGDLTSGETVRIDGIINGNCTCEKKLILSSEGQVKGNISAQSVIISGRVDGDITVQGKLELLSTGKIAGNITAGSLVIDEGAAFDGRCTMSSASSESLYAGSEV
ncbi:MAG: polymer-forming cytoskeletal protein [Lachnospiraceae bacterium]|nr:polymer-forming cytoskeletal protein [Lachnospiraceae bacterium]MDE7028532.1 polymer-forming cytoskeletal protein [Lachnospiraceae bacterium]